MKTTSLIAFLSLALYCASIARGQTLEWTRQLGTSSVDVSHSVSVDGLGNVYISGYTGGNLQGTNVGGLDAFLSKYDDSGTLQWTRQLGTSSLDQSFSVSADRLGDVYISGWTEGSLEGPTETDAFFTKYDAGGNLQWTRQIDRPGWDHVDYEPDISSDGLGNVYFVGDQFIVNSNNMDQRVAELRKYNASGTALWTRQLAANYAVNGRGVSADGLGNVYISGTTLGNLGGWNAGGPDDAYLAKYDASGTLEWTRQLGSRGQDFGRYVSADAQGNVFISGFTRGNLDGKNAGGNDVFLAKYDASGAIQWTHQLGTSENDEIHGVSADGTGGVYISGATSGSLGGPNAGGRDAFLSKFSASGALEWTQQLGSSGSDFGYGVSADGSGDVYLSGSTRGSWAGPNAGGTDAFIVKFLDLPDLNADFDGDSDVDGDDFIRWQIGFSDFANGGATKSDGDYDNDGNVDGDDFLGWQTQFGASGRSAASPPVPEASAITLACAGGLLAWMVSLHRRRRL